MEIMNSIASRFTLSLLLIALIGQLVACNSPANIAASKPTTPYAVGSTTRFLHDESRTFDSVGGVNKGVRTLITEIWYPVDHGALNAEHRRASYGDYAFGDRDVHRRMLTDTTFFHLTPGSVREGVDQSAIDAAIEELFTRRRGSYVDAPLTSKGRSMPVIVMTHGDAGSRYSMETVCEYLAAHGFLVIAPEHTGNSPFAMVGKDPLLGLGQSDTELVLKMKEILPLLDEHGVYGHDDKYGQSYIPLAEGGLTPQALVNLDAALIQRVNDLRTTISAIKSLNVEGEFTGRIDVENIGLMGRSFGGATTLAGLMLEDQFKAGMAVVPPSLPDMRAVLPVELLRAAGEESVILSREGGYALGEIHKPTLILSGGEDALIIGVSKQLAASLGGQPPTPDNRHPMLKAAYEQTKAPALYGVLNNTNHGSLGVAAPYWWPELKPIQFPKFFAPDQSYTLVDANLAHRIQQEKALEFFEYFLKGSQEAKAKLLSNDYAEAGLRWDTRNLGSE